MRYSQSFGDLPIKILKRLGQALLWYQYPAPDLDRLDLSPADHVVDGLGADP